MDWPGEDIAPPRRPRRVSTFPARFTGPGQPEVIVERIVPAYERRPSKDDAPRRGPMSTEEDITDPTYLRRRDSSFREPTIPIIETTRSKSIPHSGRDESLERRRRRRHRRSRSPRRYESEDSSQSRSNERSSDRSASYEYDRFLRRHRPRGRYDSSDESEGEWDVNREAYAFSLSRHGRDSVGQDSTLMGSSEPSLKTETNSESQVGVDGPKLGTTLHVYRSKYTGEGSVGGSQTAQLNIFHDQKKAQPALFRWIHFEDPTMHFDDFQNRVSQISGLTDIERIGLTNLLGRVRKKYDKPLQTSKGTKVRFMESGFMQETLSRGDRPQDMLSKARTAIWLCLPYFCLAEYSGVLSASRSGAHPMRTLLQARFSLVQKERDLQQAVCNVLGTPQGFCFHIAQLWCLVLDDSLMVTCARIPMSALQGDAISVISDPMPGQSRGKIPRILVLYGGSVLWSLPVDDCQTWFSFISNFLEFWPRKFRILYNGKAVTAQDWPRLLNLAKHSSHSIRLALQMGSIHQASTHGILNSSPRPPLPSSSTSAKVDLASRNQDRTFQASAPILDDAAEDSLHPSADVDNDRNQGKIEDEGVPDSPASPTTTLGGNGFHVFTWLNAGQTNQSSRGLKPDVDQLNKDLEDMDYFLSHNTTLVERIAYQECPQVSRLEVYRLLEQEGITLVKSAAKEKKQDERKPRIYELRVDIVNAAESIFQFFLPSLFEGPTVLKYWGVIHRLLVASSPDRPRDKREYSRRRPQREQDFHPTETELEEVNEELEVIVRRIQPFKDLLSQAQAADRSEIKISDELLKAWLHMIMSLINYTRDSSLWEDQMNTCSRLIEEGMKQVVQHLNRRSLHEKSVFMPLEVTSLINFQLLQDFTGTQSDDISETYSIYLKGLEADIEGNPLDRAHQDKITLLKQEMSVITETLEKQREIFATIMVFNRAQSSLQKIDGGHGRLASYGPHYDRTRSTREPQHSRLKSRVHPEYASKYDGGFQPQVAEDIIYVEDRSQTPQSKLSATDPGGYRDLLVQDCFDLIDKRMRDFGEMNGKATDLETWNIQKIDSNKDRQESAVYAFTIVTIVFLPLSTVAGILGMNTNDVRNMHVDQWVFWAVALPLAFIVISLCLLWAGELDNFWRGFVNLWRRKGDKGRAGYARIPYHPPSPPPIGLGEHEWEPEYEREREYTRPRVRERSDIYGNRRYAYV